MEENKKKWAVKSLEEKVSSIRSLIYDINKKADTLLGHAIINGTWEDYVLFKNLEKKCVDSNSLDDFALAMYKITYESAKSQTKPKATNKENYPTFLRNDIFLDIVGELRNYKSHSRGSYNTHKIKIGEIYRRYLNGKYVPENESDFEAIQNGILDDFYKFLLKLEDSIAYNKGITDIIHVDDGNVFCQNILLPYQFKFLDGCECTIIKYVNNALDKLKSTYPLYSNELTNVNFGKTSNLILSNDGNLLCDRILVPNKYACYEGCKAKVFGINIRYSKESGVVSDAIKFHINITEKKVLGLLTYNNNLPYVNGIQLDPKVWKNLKGEYVLQIVRIKAHYEGYELKESADAYVVEGMVTKDKWGSYHCGNVVLDSSAGQKLLNKRIKLNNIKINNEGNKFYYYTEDVEPVSFGQNDGQYKPNDDKRDINNSERKEETDDRGSHDNIKVEYKPIYVPMPTYKNPVEALGGVIGHYVGKWITLKMDERKSKKKK